MTTKETGAQCKAKKCNGLVEEPKDKYCPICIDKKNSNGVFYAVLLSFVFFFIVFSTYFYYFDGDVLLKQEVWGQFGDFIGGVLNPFIGLMTIYLIYRTFNLQRRELKEARTQFETSALALSEQKDLDMFYQEISLLNNSLDELDKELNQFYNLHLYIPSKRTDFGQNIILTEDELKEKERINEESYIGYKLQYLITSDELHHLQDYVVTDVKIKNRPLIKNIINTLEQIIACFQAYENCNKPGNVLPTLQSYPYPNQIKNKHRALVDILASSTIIDLNYSMSFVTKPLFTDGPN